MGSEGAAVSIFCFSAKLSSYINVKNFIGFATVSF